MVGYWFFNLLTERLSSSLVVDSSRLGWHGPGVRVGERMRIKKTDYLDTAVLWFLFNKSMQYMILSG
jgi:hypothetical protein